MRILILTQYFPPETGAAPSRLQDWTDHLAKAGHSVTVITGFPSYPKGRVFEEFRGKCFLEQRSRNIRILRCWTIVTMRRTFLWRLANYFSFVFTSFLTGLVKAGKQDVVLVEMPPLFLGISAVLLKRLRGARLAVNISDLWPKSAVALGFLKNQTLIRWATSLEEYVYREADFISGQTTGIVKDIAARFPKKSIAYIPTGVSEAVLLQPQLSIEDRDSIRHELQLGDKFVVVYAGLHGIAQALGTVLRAAEKLKRYDDIMFVFIGDGPEKQLLQKQMRELSLTNVRFYPPMPWARIPQVLSALDVGIVHLRKHDLFLGALPAKLFEAMGVGIPVVLAIRGEAQALVEAAQCGLCAEPENPSEIASAILELYQDPGLRATLGSKGRAYVEQHYNRRRIAERLEKSLVIHCSTRSASELQPESALPS